jgi:hypothetical protein
MNTPFVVKRKGTKFQPRINTDKNQRRGKGFFDPCLFVPIRGQKFFSVDFHRFVLGKFICVNPPNLCGCLLGLLRNASTLNVGQIIFNVRLINCNVAAGALRKRTLDKYHSLVCHLLSRLPLQAFPRTLVHGGAAFMMRFLFIVFILSGLPIYGAETVSGPFPKLEPVSPFPAVVAVAQADHIPLQTIDPHATTGNKITPGDSVTALVTLSENGARRTQWLLYLQVVKPGPDEKPGKPPAPVVFYSSCGDQFKFASSPAFVSLRSIGPFTEPGADGKPPGLQDKVTRFTVDQGILGIGLDRAAAALHRMVLTGTQGGFQFRDTPFSEAETRESRTLAKIVHLTSDEEKALGGKPKV